jgi:hypothetical protein
VPAEEALGKVGGRGRSDAAGVGGLGARDRGPRRPGVLVEPGAAGCQRTLRGGRRRRATSEVLAHPGAGPSVAAQRGSGPSRPSARGWRRREASDCALGHGHFGSRQGKGSLLSLLEAGPHKSQGERRASSCGRGRCACGHRCRRACQGRQSSGAPGPSLAAGWTVSRYGVPRACAGRSRRPWRPRGAPGCGGPTMSLAAWSMGLQGGLFAVALPRSVICGPRQLRNRPILGSVHAMGLLHGQPHRHTPRPADRGGQPAGFTHHHPQFRSVPPLVCVLGEKVALLFKAQAVEGYSWPRAGPGGR